MHHGFLPPHILRRLAEHAEGELREHAQASLELSAQLRGERSVAALFASFAIPAGEKRRTIYDARHKRTLPGKLVRGEGDPRVHDTAVNEAYDGAGKTYDFYKKVYGRNSVDDRGMRLDSSVHYGVHFDNAEWNGRQMIYGDGDGQLFRRFTASLDVIGHELTHGVTQYTAALDYADEPGALNEHFSDVFGVLVKQYSLRQTAAKADWLIGAGLLTKRVHGAAIRSMKAPGTAYDDPVLGKDPQPAHMRDYDNTNSDNGGVHINSGIPNHAFYLAATLLGGKAWEVAGRIWYVTLTQKLDARAQFRDCAEATWEAAGELFGSGAAPQQAVAQAWKQVGVPLRDAVISGGTRLPVLETSFAPPLAAGEIPASRIRSRA
ncbi:MAG TPA: M4 family metallopeptidase [Thermoanaerobaculia bacterium]|nr:M4 family metallopeptidase [Thermoanaerobaculia bacterium]